jgi:spermidine synthase
LGTFLIAFTGLALEVMLSRMLSVSTWYYLAFFAVSTAMLGMTAGATTVYLRPGWFTPERLNESIAKACLGYALAVPMTLILLCLLPVSLTLSIMNLLALLTVTFACALPFYFSGLAVTAVLTKAQLPIGRLYASDLIGAALGCLFVLGGLELFDGPSLILLCSSVAVLAALSFAWRGDSRTLRRLSGGLLVLITAMALLNSVSVYGIRPVAVKGNIERPTAYLLEHWNSFSRVVVFKGAEGPPQLWGASPALPRDQQIFQYAMTIDGAASTTLRRFASPADIEHLRYDITNVAYYLRPHGGALVIGVGAGRDIQSALLFGHERVVGVEVNPVFIDLLQGRFRDFAGIAGRSGVRLVVDEARSFLSRTTEEFSIIQMSLTDTWAATGAGAFSLSENSLYTEEAWQVFLGRLADDGIYTVSRWYSPSSLGETGRVVSLAVATLMRMGISDPSRHIAMLTTGHISTLLVSKQPFSEHDVALLRKVASDLEYDIAILPGVAPDDAVLRDIVAAKSSQQLQAAIADKPLNYEPPTDENPYFFNMLRLNHLELIFTAQIGATRGNLIATLTLVGLILSLLVLTAATIVVPLALRARFERQTQRPPRLLWSGAFYFSLIGSGFMLLEIALIQRLSVFLGHPAYALGILLFTIIASTGVGSYLSERLPLARAVVFLYPVVTALAIIAVRFSLTALVSSMITSPMPSKIAVSILLLFPMGVLMGFFFPTGMRIVRSIVIDETPWYWALNGIFGVLCSALAVFFSIYLGISTNFYIAAICYAITLIFLSNLYRAGQARIVSYRVV